MKLVKEKIRWRSSYDSAVDVEVAYEIYQEVKSRSSGCFLSVAEALVYEAASESCPIHREFEWDDSVAGHEYRVIQAERMIKSFVIDRPKPPRNRVAPQHESIQIEHVPPTKVVHAPIIEQSYEEDMRQAMRELMDLRSRFSHVKELRSVFREIDDVCKVTISRKDRIEEMRRRAELGLPLT